MDYIRILKRNGKFRISNEESGSIDENGIYTAHKRVSETINKDFGLSQDVVAYETILRENGGKMIAFKKEHDTREYFREEYKELAKEIKNQIMANWKNIESFGSIYLTGGGAGIIAPYLSLDSEIKIQEDPTFANVNGYLAKLSMNS